MSLVGGAVLLCSWVAQTLVYDQWNDRSAALERGELIYVSALLNVFTMETVEQTSSRPAGELHVMAFRTGLDYIIDGLPQQLRQIWKKKIADTANGELNQAATDLMKVAEDSKLSIERWKTVSRWMFIALYIAGSALIVLGQFEEGRNRSHQVKTTAT